MLINLILFSLTAVAVAVGFIVTFRDTDGGQKAQFILGIALCTAFTAYLWYVWRKILRNRDK